VVDLAAKLALTDPDDRSAHTQFALPQGRITADRLPGRKSPMAARSARSRARWAPELGQVGMERLRTNLR
jgi:hypothetical protein